MASEPWERLRRVHAELMALPNDEPPTLEEWADDYRSKYRQRYGFEAGDGLVKLAVTAERLTRKWPPLEERSRPTLKLIQGGRDDG